MSESDAKTTTEPSTASSTAGPSREAKSPSPAPVLAVADSPTELESPDSWPDLVEDNGSEFSDDDAASFTDSMTSSILKYRRTLYGRTYNRDRGESPHRDDGRSNNAPDVGHHAFTLLLGGKLHEAPLPELIDKVVDIGTGTGGWAIDFANDHPKAEIIGTDLSRVQPAWVPPNVSFQTGDFSQPWTFEDNSVDYVHLRWLCGSVLDWTELFKKAYAVLKPGGYIESFDFDANVLSDDGSSDKTALSQWGQIFQEGVRRLGSRASFNPIMEGLQLQALKDAGFVNITQKRYKLPASEWPADPVLREVGRVTRVSMTRDVEGFIRRMATLLGWSPAQISVYAIHLRHELSSLKVHGYFCGGLAWAQKPPA